MSKKLLIKKKDYRSSYSENEIIKFAAKIDEFVSKKKLREAEEYIKLKLKEKKSIDILYYSLGSIYLEKKAYKLSRKKFSKSLEINNENYSNILGIAISYFNEGNYSEANENFNKFIKFQPKNIMALNMLGNSLFLLKKYDFAINSYKKSLKLKKNQPFVYFSIASIFTLISNYKNAVGIYEEIYESKSFLKFNENNIIQFYMDYGKSLEKLNKIYLSSNLYEESIKKYNQNTDLYNSYISLLLKIENYELALSLLKRCENIDPDKYQTIANFGVYHYQTQNYKRAQEYFLRAVKIEPENYILLNNLSSAQIELELYDEAYDNAKKSLIYNSSYSMAYNNISRVFYQNDKIKESLDYAKKSYKINPSDGIYCNNIANCELALGNKKEAQKYYKKALELNPNLGDAFLMLAYGDEIDDKIIIKTLELIKHQKLPDKILGSFYFGLYKVSENKKKYKEAFKYLTTANKLYFNTTNLSILNKTNYFKKYKKFINIKKNLYSKKNLLFLKKNDQEINHSIFITGLPRSGTTLLEQMVSSHAKVYGAGELTHIGEIKRKFGLREEDVVEKKNFDSNKELLSILNDKKIKLMNKEYIEKISENISEKKPFLTDKMPSNYLNIGLINLMLPNSKIIHIKKDIMDICFSLFSAKFKKGHEFSYDLSFIVEMYKNYEDIMNHWNEVLPKKIHLVEYKNLIQNTEEEIKKTLDFCELEFDKKCLDYEGNKRIVLTASSYQVREKLDKNYLGRWKNYKADLCSYFDKNNIKL